jgi:hypothetical protein
VEHGRGGGCLVFGCGLVWFGFDLTVRGSFEALRLGWFEAIKRQ